MDEGTQNQTEKPAAKPKAAPAPSKQPGGWFAAVRIRGDVGITDDIRKTLLRLHQKMACSVYPDSPTVRGMLQKVKDHITFGVIDEATLSELARKRGVPFAGREKDARGKLAYTDYLTIDKKKFKPFFRLNPPRGGFERKPVGFVVRASASSWTSPRAATSSRTSRCRISGCPGMRGRCPG